jgi:two-component system, OmpR family, KDP operon response regulator KdpE
MLGTCGGRVVDPWAAGGQGIGDVSGSAATQLRSGREGKTVMGVRVLVVDDEPSIVRVVAANLRARGYEALTATSGTAALTMIEGQQPDCIVLDLGLPDLGGLEVLRRLRAWATTPVVILTARENERDRATALELGADDYVTKPFAMPELLARISGALGHDLPSSLDLPRRIEAGPVCIDLDAGLVTRWGRPVRLTPTEYMLLEILATSRGRLCTSRFLSECLWGPESEQTARSLREHVASLRRKLDDPAVPELLVTEPGMGYRFVLPS